jgi:hypothetical protein
MPAKRIRACKERGPSELFLYIRTVTALLIAAIALGLVLVLSILGISLGLAQSAAHGDAVMRRAVADLLRRRRKNRRAA